MCGIGVFVAAGCSEADATARLAALEPGLKRRGKSLTQPSAPGIPRAIDVGYL